MDSKRFEQLLDALKRDALKTIKNSSPVRTGNLQSAVKVRDLPNGGFEIYIDTLQASYAEATTGPWVHGRWHGRANPNEGWDQEAAQEFIKRTKIRLKGMITSKGVTKNGN